MKITIKLDNVGHPTVETEQILPIGWFQRWFSIFKTEICLVSTFRWPPIFNFKFEG